MGRSSVKKIFLFLERCVVLLCFPIFLFGGAHGGIRRQKATSLEICKVVALRVDGVVSKVSTQKALKFCSLT